MATKFKQTSRNTYRLLQAILANIYYGFPSKKLKLIGVTGTDGKTTTTYMIYNILLSAGKKVGLINTIEARIGNQITTTGLHVTTPSPWTLNKLLRKMVQEGLEYAVLEVSSHGLDQNRVWGIHFSVGVVTNITSEHLDYHLTYENYLKAKMKLLKISDDAVVNRDATAFEDITKFLKGKKFYTFGQDQQNLANFADLESITLQVPGIYNKENALAAISVAKILGLDLTSIKHGLEDTVPPKGRFNILQETPFRVIVDFAHTPNSLELVLNEARTTTLAKLFVVFGCAGERDRKKRPTMGAISVKYADRVFLTAEDPRSESAEDINNEILAGIPSDKKSKVTVINDRKVAIKTALENARDGDTVIITGKGHEESMCFGKTEYPWNDLEVSRDLLQEWRSQEKS